MVFIFDALMGYNRNKYELSEEERVQLADRLKSIFPNQVDDVDDITVEAIEKKKEKVQHYEAYLDMLNTKLDQQRQDLENYDIVAINDLISWEKGDTIAPDVEDWLKEVVNILQMRDKELEVMNELLQQLRDGDKLEYMLREECSKFLLPKLFWEYINENRENDKVLMVIIILLKVDVTGANIYNLIKYILCNPQLIEYYLLEQIG